MACLAGGSPRRLIELARGDGVALYTMLRDAIETGNADAQARLAALASDGDVARRLAELWEDYLVRRIRSEPEPAETKPPPGLPLVTWVRLWENARTSGREVETYNLDRRQYVLDLIESSAASIQRRGIPHRR